MRNKLLLVLFLLVVVSLNAKPPDSVTKASYNFSSSIDLGTWIDANRILMFVTNVGSIGYDQSASLVKNDGMYYPYSSVAEILDGTLTNSVIFAGGFWIGGIDSATGDILVAVSEYTNDFWPGPMESGTFIPNTDTDPKYRVYKLYKDSMGINPNQDYLEWPSGDGAPTDIFGNPILIGDQTLWSVYNDANPDQKINSAGSIGKPLGIEVQHTTWAVDEIGTDSIPGTKFIAVTQLYSTNAKVEVTVSDSDLLTGHEYTVETNFDVTIGSYWKLIDNTLGQVLVDFQDFSLGSSAITIDGMRIAAKVVNLDLDWEYSSANPLNVSPVAQADNGYTGGSRWFTGGGHGGELLFGGVFLEPHFWGATTLEYNDYATVEVRWRPMASYTDLNGSGEFDIGEPFVVDDPSKTQKAFMYSSFFGSAYLGFFDVPFTVWDVSDPFNHRQLNVVIRDRDQNHAWSLHSQLNEPLFPNEGDQRFNYTWILATSYDPTGTYYGDGTNGTVDFWDAPNGAINDGMWVMWLDERGTSRGMLAEECILKLKAPTPYQDQDSFSFSAVAPPVFSIGPDAVSIYTRYKIINKGGKNLKDVFVSLWFDPDLGDAGDDFVGCDTLENIFFCYNDGDDRDYGKTPPAVGVKLIEGPIVPSPGDTAYVNGEMIFNYKNQEMYSFSKMFAGLDPNRPSESYNYMKGLGVWGDPIGNGTKYFHPGNPVTGIGDTDHSSSDRRMMGSYGPFDFAPGDTQQVFIKLAVGQGVDELNSVTRLREILNAPIFEQSLQAKAIIHPDTLFAFFLNAIEPMNAKIDIGNFQDGKTASDVDFSSIRINSSIVPDSIYIFTSNNEIIGETIKLTFKVADLIKMHTPLWDITNETFTVSGKFNDSSPFSIDGPVVFRGHSSGDLNLDGIADISDIVFLIDYLFRDGAPPKFIEMIDMDGSCDEANISDLTYMISYFYRNGDSLSTGCRRK